MQINLLNGVAARVGSMIAVSALLFLTIFSYFFYKRTVQNEILVTTHSLSQLIITVENSAAIASYLNNIEIATEVVQGLKRNDMVSGVSIQGNSGLYLATGDMNSRKDVEVQRYSVLSPLGNGKSVGQITINPNHQLIDHRARETAKIQVLSMAVQTLIIVTLVMIIVYWQLTTPIQFVARQLHSILPGSKQRLSHPIGHRGNEIGELVKDTNRLLNTVQSTIEKERSLRMQVESLERRFRLIFEHASSGIVLTTLKGKIVLHNPAFEKMVGNKSTTDLEASGSKTLPDIFELHQKVRSILEQISLGHSPIAIDLNLLNYGQKASCLHCLFSSVETKEGELLVETICYDVSQRTLREKKAQLEADIDPLTKLFNRRAGMRELNSLLDKCQIKKSCFSVFMIDLDEFKQINDTFGHESGDKVLCEIAKRMVNTVRKNDFVVRLGGDEFLIAITEGHGEFDVAPVAMKILHLLHQKIDLGEGRMVHVGGSIGISLYPKCGIDISSLINQADQAMYKVKKEGRNGYCFAREEPIIMYSKHTTYD